jgi:hypothetical protein
MFYIIVILAGIFAVPAKADETLKFRKVQYTTSQQVQQIGDVPGHLQGFSRYVGVATFPDGSTARDIVFGAFDGVVSAGNGGTFVGYENIVFSDGSELWLKATGSFKVINQTENGNHITANGSFIVTSGKGRYAGAKGDGTYEGFQDTVGRVPGETLGVIDIVLNVKK